MGMDISGKKPVSETGSYFRNNVWWWRPLWQYCHSSAPELIDRETFDSGTYNEGAGLNAYDAAKLGVKLLVLVEDGSCATYKRERDLWLESLKDDNCSRCNNNNRGYNKKKECKSCDGKGTQDNWNKHYPFHEDNVKEFADFCIDSGGFEIW
jgi:hypothetical protein